MICRHFRLSGRDTVELHAGGPRHVRHFLFTVDALDLKFDEYILFCLDHSS